MNLTVLGSGGIYPDPNRAGPAFLLDHAGARLLLDIGPGALRSLVRAGGDPADLNGVCITHRHPDHTGELGLLIDLERSRSRTEPIVLCGPCILDDFLAFYLRWGRKAPAPVPYEIERLIMPGRGSIGPFSVEGAAVAHVDHSVGYRVTAGRTTVVYAGDCGPGDEVVRLGENADLLILEASLPPGNESATHLSPEDAAEIAQRAAAKRLLLTHFPPDADVNAAVAICQKMGIETQAARDLARYEL